MMKNKLGFTLVELLVVAAITAMLALVIIVNLEKAKKKSRDSQRKADLSKVAGALALYKADYKIYPNTMTPDYEYTPGGFVPFNYENSSVTTLTDMLVGHGYLSAIPVDPLNTGNPFYINYLYRSSAERFKLTVLSETIKTSDSEQTIKDKAGEYYESNCLPERKAYFQLSSDGTAASWCI